MSTDRVTARREWLAAQAPLGAAGAGHDVLARLASPEEVPVGAHRLARAAEAAGWDVVVSCAHDGTEGHVMVSMRHPATGRRVVGVWRGRSFDFGYTDDGVVDGPGLRAALMVAAGRGAVA